MKSNLQIKSVGKYDVLYNKYIHYYKCYGCKKKIKTLKSSKTVLISGFCGKCGPKHRFSKKVRFKHYKNNNIVEAESITAFCQLFNDLGHNAKYHFSEVINGKRLHYMGWMLASNKSKIDLAKVRIIKQIIIKPAIIEKL